jgi:glycine/D-amino acid oxidase-like deaminating enzyme
VIKVDYIIVGQGLAGSTVAVQLLKRGQQILVIDQYSKNTSSHIAAGLYNPVTGKNAVKTWLADEIFPYLERFYGEVEDRAGKKFLFPKLLYRPFASIHDQNEWMGKSSDEMYAQYIEGVKTKPQYSELNDPFGGILLKRSGYLSTSIYLSVVREMIRESSLVWDEMFDDELLHLSENFVSYKEVTARKIIFCQGERSFQNKWFGSVPIRPLKGETIVIKSDWKTDVIVNRGVYIVPGNKPGEYRVGSTYKYNDRSPFVTQEGLIELQGKLNDLLRVPYEICEHEWGVRPTTIDRRPILGSHPIYENLIIFNGLGTKGVSLAPYFSEVLIRWLENREPLNKEVSVARYK